MKIAILGTKGIPNNYGGYEQFAEFISQRLIARGHEVTVYNPSFHAYRESTYKGARIVRKYSPEPMIGGSANFIYDFLCLRDALTRDFDLIYEAGYHSVAPAYRLLGIKNILRPVIVTNMDGLEYNRSKWNYFTQRLIRVLERIAVRDCRHLISDNIGIQEYYRQKFGRESHFLPYGADPETDVDPTHLNPYRVTPGRYVMLVARFEPENNLETVLEGFLMAGLQIPFLVVGNHKTKFGRYLQTRFADERIRFTGGIYSKPELDALRHHAAAYVHGHSVGGTNPSLLEAMACRSFILAHDNPFNRHVLFDSAFYFTDTTQVRDFMTNLQSLRQSHANAFGEENAARIKNQYNWDKVVDQHEALFDKLVHLR